MRQLAEKAAGTGSSRGAPACRTPREKGLAHCLLRPSPGTRKREETRMSASEPRARTAHGGHLLHALRLVLGAVWLAGSAAQAGDLVGYWKMDEGSGSTAADSSVSGMNLGFTGNPTFDPNVPSVSFSD